MEVPKIIQDDSEKLFPESRFTVERRYFNHEITDLEREAYCLGAMSEAAREYWESQSIPSPAEGQREAIEVLDWLVKKTNPENPTTDTIQMVDGDFYYGGDDDGDHPMDAKEIHQLFLEHNSKQP